MSNTNMPLIYDSETPRNSRQQAQIDIFLAKQPPDAVLLLQDRLNWAYRCFRVTVQNSSDPGIFGDGAPDREQLFQNYLYLFNVIVALEWRPSWAYMQQLQTTFQRASNFLYDVTDGYMAFGQVVFGGSELMQCADIQIMASNRFNPRSWVSGLRDPKKYMPIRLGRGVWHKNNRVCIPWDEPEGYRTLIHEWAHYALELRDEYLEPCPVLVPSHVSYASMSEQILVSGNATLIIPKFSLASESIMATLEGTSELVPHHRGKSAERKRDEWETIAEHFEKLDPKHEPLEGPSELPLPLPRFYRVGSLASGAGQTIQSGAGSGAAAAPQAEEIVINDFPKGMSFAHCWVYVIQGTLEAPQRIIAQGTLEARASDDGLLLLGAHTGDTVVLIGADNKGRAAIRCGVIALVGNGTGPRYKIKSWRVATPTFPMIDVLPDDLDPGSDDQIARISVRINGVGAQPPSNVWIFPLGQIAPADSIAIDWADMPGGQSAPQPVPTLDGHILVRWPDDTLVICTYSQSGGPQTSTPTGPPPISAGSSEGNVMLFFENKDQMLDYSDVRVVTTLIHGMPSQLLSGAQARSYTFSLASNQPLPGRLNPTLIMHYDRDATGDEGDLLIYQHIYDDSEASAAKTSTWSALPTYLPPGASFVAVPLNFDTADRLTDLNQDSKKQRVERYRLYWRLRQEITGAVTSIDSIPSRANVLQPVQYHSCFISYSTKDTDFARQLYERMRSEHLQVWFALEDMEGGKKIYEQIDRAIELHDRLLLVLSEHSIHSEWVMTEIRRARKQEIKENRRKLFPLRLTSYDTLREWTCFDTETGKDLAVEVHEYFISDFSHWKDHDAFEAAFIRLLRDLRAAEPPTSSSA